MAIQHLLKIMGPAALAMEGIGLGAAALEYALGNRGPAWLGNALDWIDELSLINSIGEGIYEGIQEAKKGAVEQQGAVGQPLSQSSDTTTPQEKREERILPQLQGVGQRLGSSLSGISFPRSYVPYGVSVRANPLWELDRWWQEVVGPSVRWEEVFRDRLDDLAILWGLSRLLGVNPFIAAGPYVEGLINI